MINPEQMKAMLDRCRALKKNEDGTYTVIATPLDTPNGKIAETLLDDTNQPAAFAMRAFVDDKIVDGKTTRVIRDIITYDLVSTKET